MASHDGRRTGGLNVQTIVRVATIALAVTAVVKELRTPRDERTWNGTVAGFVPYDFRMPTAERFMERVWNPDGSRLVNPRVFGVGWTLNIGKVVGMIQERIAARQE